MNETVMETESGGVSDKYVFGFWIYLMTDLIMFASLFAAFAVLRGATFGGPAEHQLYDLKNALAETLLLLTSSFTCGLAMLAAYRRKEGQAIVWFAATFALGASFLGLELREFSAFAAAGHTPQASASLSAFYTLVGTHGAHIAVGLLWMAVAIVQVRIKGLSPFVVSKLERLGAFWHFLDIVWIFIFTIVYLMGHML
jgi:cytochrome o ubiquinol oxidase subunit 3